MTDVVGCATTSGPTVGREIDDDPVLSGPTAFAAGRPRGHARFIATGNALDTFGRGARAEHLDQRALDRGVAGRRGDLRAEQVGDVEHVDRALAEGRHM